MVRKTLLATLALAVAGLVGVTPADAQDYPDYKVDLGINAGGTWYTSALSDDLPVDDIVRFEPGWITGAQLTLWVAPRFGIRANGTYSERPLVLGTELNSDNDLVWDVNLWGATGDILYRLTEDGYRLGGMVSRPYLALGAGVKNINSAVEVDIGDDLGHYFTVGGDQFALIEAWKPMGLVGLGTDFRMAENFALRLELGDRFWGAPMREASEDIGNLIHEPYLTLGAHVLLGLEAEEVVAVPPPPPEPEPEPEPEPIEEEIVVCVVDPTADGGLVEVNAIYLPETGDTVVVEDDMRRDFQTVIPAVTVVSDADWFVQGEPLSLAIGDGATLEYTTWQSARMIDANRLTYLGTSRGLPVYANTDDVADVRQAMMDARAASMTGDLGDILEENAELAAALEDVEYLYVPLRSTGCVFQAVRMIEQVRKK